MMEETNESRPIAMSEETLEFMKEQEPFQGKEKELDCYKECLDDGLDLKEKKPCPLICGFK
jgi:hypothetical protein